MPWLLENVPAWHVWHWASLVRLHAVDVNWPGAQVVHGVQVLAFDVVEYVPCNSSAQEEQILSEVAEQSEETYLPLVHVRQVEHVLLAVAPTAVEKVPALQPRQAALAGAPLPVQ